MKLRIKVFFLIVAVISAISFSVYAENSSDILYDYGAASIRNSFIKNENPNKYTENTVTELLPATCDGFEFMGWYLEPEYITEVTEISDSTTGNITLYAKWYEMSYNISYVLTTPDIPIASSEISNRNVFTRLASEEIFLSEPEYIYDKYTFDGWYTDSNYTQKVQIINAYTCKDITLYAHWVNSEFSISYDFGEVAFGVYPVENPNPKTYTYSVSLDILPAYTNNPAYTFEGWYGDEFFTNEVTKIGSENHGNITLYAKWKKNEFKINYVLTDASGIKADTISNPNAETRTADVDFNIESPITSDKSYEFVGWYTESDLSDYSKITKIKAGDTDDITLYAKWQKSIYKINFDFGSIDTHSCDITNKNKTSYVYGESIELEPAYISGFIFNGWCTDKSLKNPISEITPQMYGDITLYADFTEKTYTINYIVEDKEVTASQVLNTSPTIRTTSEKIYFEDAQTINVDYKFGGWYYDSNFEHEATFIKAYTAENITVYAKWIRIVTYTPVWGDASLSQNLTAADARLILRYAAGLETAFTELQIRLSDINNDSKVTASDARLALRMAANIDSEEDIIKKFSLPEITIVDGEVVFK